jgi:hypothetical protein
MKHRNIVVQGEHVEALLDLYFILSIFLHNFYYRVLWFLYDVQFSHKIFLTNVL